MLKRFLPTTKKNTIKFLVKEKFEGIDKPIKGNKAFPKWFKDCPRYHKKGNAKTGTVKTCLPFIDAMSLGYVVPLWADLRIIVDYELELYNENSQRIHHDGFPLIYNTDIMNEFDLGGEIQSLDDLIGVPFPNGVIHSIKKGNLNVFASFPSGFGFGEDVGLIDQHQTWQIGGKIEKFELGSTVLKLHAPWVVNCPDGYSLYFKNPANHFESNLELFEGLVDVDQYPLNVNFPFIWRSSERVDMVLPKGTPLCQIIPIKREEFNEEYGVFPDSDFIKYQNKLSSKMWNRYKEFWWHKRKAS